MKKKTFIFATITLSIIVLALFMQNRSLRIDERYEDGIPDIELSSNMTFYNNESYVASGTISGFVVFPKIEDQPKGGMRQYYILTSTVQLDGEKRQMFTLGEYIKMPYLAPRNMGTEILKVTSSTPQYLTLKGNTGQTFNINKATGAVSIIDTDGDITNLITNDSEFQKFMLVFLK